MKYYNIYNIKSKDDLIYMYQNMDVKFYLYYNIILVKQIKLCNNSQRRQLNLKLTSIIFYSVYLFQPLSFFLL